MEFKSEHWLMVLCWGELDNEKKIYEEMGQNSHKNALILFLLLVWIAF
jgi:hypothetical protein